MAQPIRKTPTLKSEDAEKFVSKMLETTERRINKSEKEIIKLISDC